MATARTRRTYGHRFRALVRQTGDVGLATDRGVPRSTARDWSRSSKADIVSLDLAERSTLELERQVAILQERLARLLAVLRLFVVLTKVRGITPSRRRLPGGTSKRQILRAIERSREAFPLRAALRVLGLSSSRYHSWEREEVCALDDAPPCPRSHPH